MFEAKTLDVIRDDRKILSDVSVAFQQSEIFCVIGANGAGKSTLLSCLAGDIRPDRGEVLIEGRSLQELDRKEHARERAVLRQKLSIEFPMAVEDVVALGRIPHRTSAWSDLVDDVVEEQLKRFELQTLRRRGYDSLSGGEQQRAHLARVVAQLSPFDGPRWLLLDEPTSALDVSQSHRLMGFVRELSEDGLGVFWVTHDLNLAGQYANRISVLKSGQEIASGDPTIALTKDVLATAFGIDATVQQSRDGVVVVVHGAH